MVSIDPCFGAEGAVGRNDDDNVLGPDGPALEVASQSQSEGDAAVVVEAIHVAPSSHQNHCLGGIGAWALEEGVDVVARLLLASQVVGVVLDGDLQAIGAENVGEVLRPVMVRLVAQVKGLEAVGAEDVVLAAAKVGMDLAGQDGVFGDVGAAGIVIEREQQQPGDAD